MPFQAKVVDGHLQLSIPIPIEKCAICGLVSRHDVRVASAEMLYNSCHPISMVFDRPSGWVIIRDATYKRSARICPTCATPITAAKLAGEENEKVAALTLSSKVVSWG